MLRFNWQGFRIGSGKDKPLQMVDQFHYWYMRYLASLYLFTSEKFEVEVQIDSIIFSYQFIWYDISIGHTFPTAKLVSFILDTFYKICVEICHYIYICIYIFVFIHS